MASSQTQQGYRQDQAQRGGGQMMRHQGEQSAIARFNGTYSGSQVAALLQEAAQSMNLVAPATAVGQLPEGTAVALSAIQIDTREMIKGGEVYKVGDNYGLSKPALDKIAAAAGISWERDSRRLDDGSDPRYVHYRAVGTYVHFDGSRRTIIGEKELDLRDGSDTVDRIFADARTRESGTKQLRDMRSFILGHAETKARLRAIRSLGIKTSYPMEDLRKPFVVARLMFTGYSDDPVIRRENAAAIRQSLLGGMQALYGPPALPQALPAVYAPTPAMMIQAPAPAMLGPSAPTPAAHRPPHVGAVQDDDDDGRGAQEAVPGRAADVAPGDATRLRLPQKGGGGPTIREADDERLQKAETWIAKRLDEGKVDDKYLTSEQKLLATIRAERERRAAERAAAPDGPGPIPDDIDQPYGDDGQGHSGRDPDDPNSY